MSQELAVKFWGVRGSYPAPGHSTLHYGGNTPCVELQVDNQTIILDAGTGIINLGSDLLRRSQESGKPVAATVLFSHMHHDHTQGFPFFTPAYDASSLLHMFGPSHFAHSLREVLNRAVLPPAFPLTLEEMQAFRTIQPISETDVLLLGEAVGGAAVRNLYHDRLQEDEKLIRIRTLRSYAHPDGVHTYRIEWNRRSIVYATDVEGYIGGDQRLIAFSRNADLLIHDAQYTEDHYLGRRPGNASTQGWGHSTASMACAVAQQAQVKELVLFHHEPQYEDELLSQIEAEAQRCFPSSRSAREGMQLHIPAG